LGADEVRTHRPHARESPLRSAIQDGQVTGEQLGRQPNLGRTFVRRVGGQGQGVAAELRDLAAVHGEDGRPDPGGHAAVGVDGFPGGPQGEIPIRHKSSCSCHQAAVAIPWFCSAARNRPIAASFGSGSRARLTARWPGQAIRRLRPPAALIA
jgi:hypothetical protein